MPTSWLLLIALALGQAPAQPAEDAVTTIDAPPANPPAQPTPDAAPQAERGRTAIGAQSGRRQHHHRHWGPGPLARDPRRIGGSDSAGSGSETRAAFSPAERSLGQWGLANSLTVADINLDMEKLLGNGEEG